MPSKIYFNIEVLKEYVKTHTIKETAKYFKVSTNTIDRNLCNNYIIERKPLFNVDKVLLQKYIQGHTIEETAKYFKTSYTTIRRRLVKYEIDERRDLANLYPSELTDVQQNMITGWLLGDGSIPCIPNRPNKYFKFGQKLASLEYVEFVHDAMKPFSYEIKKSREKYYFYTCAIPLFTDLRNKWYVYPEKVKSKKNIPKDIKLNWETVAYWYMDDGTNKFSGKHLVLSTCDFTNEDILFLMCRLELDLGIGSTTYFNSDKIYNPNHDKYPLVRIRSKHYFEFIENVMPYVGHLKCFDYKLNLTNLGEINAISC